MDGAEVPPHARLVQRERAGERAGTLGQRLEVVIEHEVL